jgi:hypothetical protein
MENVTESYTWNHSLQLTGYHQLDQCARGRGEGYLLEVAQPETTFGRRADTFGLDRGR